MCLFSNCCSAAVKSTCQSDNRFRRSQKKKAKNVCAFFFNICFAIVETLKRINNTLARKSHRNNSDKIVSIDSHGDRKLTNNNNNDNIQITGHSIRLNRSGKRKQQATANYFSVYQTNKWCIQISNLSLSLAKLQMLLPVPRTSNSDDQLHFFSLYFYFLSNSPFTNCSLVTT